MTEHVSRAEGGAVSGCGIKRWSGSRAGSLGTERRAGWIGRSQRAPAKHFSDFI